MFFLLKKIKAKYIFAFLGFALIAVFAAAFQLPDGDLHIYFFDVGQGDAILIKTPSNQQILIDGGPDQSVSYRLSEVLPFYDRDLDLIVLTHPHADHVTGLIDVLSRYRVQRALITEAGYSSAPYQAFSAALEEHSVSVFTARRGQRINFGDGTSAEILWPPAGFTSDDLNEVSIVLALEFGDFSALMTGDAPEPSQWEMLTLGGLAPVDVLKVPHQGAKDGLDWEFLTAIRPLLAVISVGEGNRFGHPHSETLEELESFGVVTRRTDQDGTIEVISDGESWYFKDLQQ